MRLARMKVGGRPAVYHLISRVVGGQRLLGAAEMEYLRGLVWRQAEFSGVEVLTYCLMANHIHLLVRVPSPRALSDAELVARCRRYYRDDAPLPALLEEDLARGRGISASQRTALEARMFDVSVFMKELKQRFSKWYNGRSGRFGTLWAERFKSVLVEDKPGSVALVARYIDLNPVRASIVDDPAEYRWSGYGEAMGGGLKARTGICSVLGVANWSAAAGIYRMGLYVRGGASPNRAKAAISKEAILETLRQRGQVSVADLLRLRVRYFTDGVVLGSKQWVNEVFGEFRSRFGPRRKDGARTMRGFESTGLSVLRDLRVNLLC